jgi:hypothetical protein
LISWRIISFLKWTLHRHRACIELRRASPFMKLVKDPKTLKKDALARTMIPLFVLRFIHFWRCWQALLAAMSTFVKSLHCADHHPIRIWNGQKRLVTAWPVMTKSWALSWGGNNPESGLVKPPRRDTRALSQAGMFGGKAPLRLAAQKNRPHVP